MDYMDLAVQERLLNLIAHSLTAADTDEPLCKVPALTLLGTQTGTSSLALLDTNL